VKGARSVMFFMMAACLAACGNGTTTASTMTVPLGREFTLRVGETATVDGAALRVSVDKVAEDSRCPVDVQCVWEGDAIVSVAIADAAAPRSYQLHTSGRYEREATHGAYQVTLVRLDPAPRSTVPLSSADYRATLLVSQ
jgi:hypothetical protein